MKNINTHLFSNCTEKITCSPTKHFKTALTKLGLLCPDVQRLIITIQDPVVRRLIITIQDPVVRTLINLELPFNQGFFSFVEKHFLR